nr:hypothetical protein [Tanacetum cinerariifolium]
SETAASERHLNLQFSSFISVRSAGVLA